MFQIEVWRTQEYADAAIIALKDLRQEALRKYYKNKGYFACCIVLFLYAERHSPHPPLPQRGYFLCGSFLHENELPFLISGYAVAKCFTCLNLCDIIKMLNLHEYMNSKIFAKNRR